MKPWKWVKEHPAEAAAIAAAIAITGGYAAAAVPAVAGGATAAGASGAVAADAAAIAAMNAGAAGASTAVGADAAAIAAANAAAAGGAGAGAFGGGEAVSGLAASHAAGAGAEAGLGAEAALLAAYPAEDFAAQMAGSTIAGESAMLSPYTPAGSSIAGAGAESSLYGPNVGTDPSAALDSRSWFDKATEKLNAKLKDPKTVMHLGMMAAQLGTPRQQGGPAQYPESSSMRSANQSQEDITKKWLMINDPNTYRRIYGNPQGVA